VSRNVSHCVKTRLDAVQLVSEASRISVGWWQTNTPTFIFLAPGRLFQQDDVSTLFPGNLNKKESADRKKLAMRYLDVFEKVPRGHLRAAELGKIREEFPRNPATTDEGNCAIRFDLRLPLTKPEDRPREIWLDHAIVHESASSYAEGVLKFLESAKENQPGDSPAFVKMQQKKSRHYAALIEVAERLLTNHRLCFQPKFLFPVVSSLGFLNKDMQQLMKIMVERFKENQEGEPEREDGLQAGHLKGRFKVYLKNSICFALIKGLTLATSNQGIKGVVRPV